MQPRPGSRPWLAETLLAAFAVLATAPLRAAPPDVWSAAPVPADTLSATFTQMDQAAAGLPAEVKPAVQFQKTLLQIRGGSSTAAWRGDLERAASDAGTDGVTVALRELARAWLARLSMAEIDKALRGYYRHEVRFPDTLVAVKADIPAAAALDPWGEIWTYKPHPPQAFAKLSKQRYQLGPARYPALSTFEDAVKAPASTRTWKLTSRNVAGAKAVELRGSDGKTAVLQPGGRVGDVTVAFIGEGWALLADTERLFTVAF